MMVVKNIIDNVMPSIWPLVAFVLIVVISLRIAYLFNGSKKIVIYKEILNLIFIIYILCLYHLLTYQNVGYSGINLVPFKEMFRYTFGSYKFMKNIVGNIIIFLPFGFFTSYYLNTKKWVSPVLITLIVSLGAEGIQYYIGRIFDVDDIILNVLGGFLGYLLFVAFSAVRGKLPKFMRSDGFLNFIVILIVVIIVLFSVGINIFSYL